MKTIIRAGTFCFGLSALAASAPALADLNCKDLMSTYDREPQMAKERGYFVTQDEAIRRGGVGGYVQVLPEKDQKLERSCEKQNAGIAPVDLKNNPQTVFFNLGDKSLKKEDLSKLDSVADQIKNGPEVTIVRLEGYTDSLGSPETNMVLSHDRAQSVEKYLESQGVSPKEIQIIAYGEQKSKQVTGHQGNPQDRKVVISVG
jgi:outer membrane protein OmpA-like peptidoglycan-associated protein